MKLERDLALIGNGVAPLIAASYLQAQGKSVVLLNPDWDFFLENSELPLDPHLLQFPCPSRKLLQQSPEQMLKKLRPYVPGVLEYWDTPEPGRRLPTRLKAASSPPTAAFSAGGSGTTSAGGGFYDPSAPHVRRRSKIWLTHGQQQGGRGWDQAELEDFYLKALEAHLKPTLLTARAARQNFPGFFQRFFQDQAGEGEEGCALVLSKFCDIDLVRFRYRLLEFQREKLTAAGLFCAAQEIQPCREGLQFSHNGATQIAHLKEGSMIFWTPHLSPLLCKLTHTLKPSTPCAKKAAPPAPQPLGVRVWEQWLFRVPAPLDPSLVITYPSLALWSHLEGKPELSGSAQTLAVLRAGQLLQDGQRFCVPPEAMEDLSALFRLSRGQKAVSESLALASLTTHGIFEWPPESEYQAWWLRAQSPRLQVVPGSDGSLGEIVSVVERACQQMLAP